MPNTKYEKLKFNIAIYRDENFSIENILSKECKDLSLGHYNDLELLLEDIYSSYVNLIILSVENFDKDMEYILNILNNQAESEEVPVIAIAKEDLIDKYLMLKYPEIDFLHSPLNYVKIKHRIKIYGRFFDKKFELQRATDLANKELKTIQELLNVHNGMLLLFKADDIAMMNKQFLQFTNFKSFDEFYLNSSKKFVLEDGELRCSTDGENEWIQELIALDEAKRIILMQDSEGIRRSFKVGINKFTLEDEYTLITFDDITNLYNQAKMFEQYAHYDALTSLANRRKFDEDVQKHIKSHIRHEYELSLIIMDIDHFKKINDSFGHNEGDNILKLLANLLKEYVREEDLVTRWGGEEFVILLPYTSLEKARIVAENLREKVHFITLADGKELNCSFGVAQYYDHLLLEQWISNADAALYEAKESGRDKVKVFTN